VRFQSRAWQTRIRENAQTFGWCETHGADAVRSLGALLPANSRQKRSSPTASRLRTIAATRTTRATTSAVGDPPPRDVINGERSHFCSPDFTKKERLPTSSLRPSMNAIATTVREGDNLQNRDIDRTRSCRPFPALEASDSHTSLTFTIERFTSMIAGPFWREGARLEDERAREA
jgi:hypothetical protein